MYFAAWKGKKASAPGAGPFQLKSHACDPDLLLLD
jgi:hypothetical protein